MDKLVFTDWILLITAIGTIVALISNATTLRDKGKRGAATTAEMQANIKYIREMVDKLEKKMDDIPERVAAVEASAASAHKRIDRLENK